MTLYKAQASYQAKQKARGLSKMAIWVPDNEQSKKQVSRLASSLRMQHNRSLPNPDLKVMGITETKEG